MIGKSSQKARLELRNAAFIKQKKKKKRLVDQLVLVCIFKIFGILSMVPEIMAGQLLYIILV